MEESNYISTSIEPIPSCRLQLVEPQFRLACEECHVRKIRCEPSLAVTGSSCEACRLNQRRCLFSLRSKIGRPRKQTSTTNQEPLSVDKSPVSSAASGYTQRTTATQALPQSDDTPINPNLSQRPIESLQNNLTDAHHHTAGDQAPYEKAPWHSKGKATPPRTLPIEYLEDITRAGAGGEGQFSQLMTPGSIEGARAEFFLTDLAQSSNPLQAGILMDESWFIPDHAVGDNAKVDREEGFLDALRLYSDLHNRCKSKAFNLFTEADQVELCSIFRVFDDLIQKASMLQPNDPSSLLQVTNQPKWRIIRVAVMEAIELCIEVIQFNFQLHITTLPVDESTGRPQEELSSDSSGSGTNTVKCSCLVSIDEQRLNNQLRCLQLLIRLDYSLVRFRHFISKMNCLHGGHRYIGASTMQWSNSQQVCKCYTTAIPDIDTVRSQVSVLVEKLRSLWD
ncbi:hypothetical protein BDV29DRAFT_198958 [Aspergillus leporis]|uniref:Zn(2)-C6 fungal-type domain-containing protein n=1 Tax=Aspergillus leporis TaxID=41062 RepID=A0A5N5WKV2_9EURO|nr:hypothetical protein BDV29DRAFT_198958 [Aspergillus leporis]